MVGCFVDDDQVGSACVQEQGLSLAPLFHTPVPKELRTDPLPSCLTVGLLEQILQTKSTQAPPPFAITLVPAWFLLPHDLGVDLAFGERYIGFHILVKRGERPTVELL